MKDLVIEEGDLELLKEYLVDYIGFSYYMLIVVDVIGIINDIVNGNFLGGVKNFFLEVSEWGW